MGPGSMLLAAEYTFGLCLSWLQRTHSVDIEQSRRQGNLSEQVAHCGEFSEAM